MIPLEARMRKGSIRKSKELTLELEFKLRLFGSSQRISDGIGNPPKGNNMCKGMEACKRELAVIWDMTEQRTPCLPPLFYRGGI